MHEAPGVTPKHNQLPPAVRLGGERQGGEMTLATDTPLDGYSRDDGFMIGNLPADLIAVLGVGHTDGKLGVIKTDFAGNEPDDPSNILFVKLKKTAQGDLSVADKEYGSPAAHELRPGAEPLNYGRQAKHTSSVLLELESRDSQHNLRDENAGTVSRNQLTIGLSADGTLTLRDNESLNGIYVQRQEKPADADEKVLDADLGALGGVVVASEVEVPDDAIEIDRVPQTGEEARQMRQADAGKRELAKQARLEPLIAEVEHKMDDIRAKVSDEDQLNLWRYASAMALRRDSQKAGDAQQADNESRNANGAYNALSAVGKANVQLYAQLFNELGRLRA